jgi:peroxiredoxin
MYPHERSLVDEMKGEKFTLFGVNSDSTPTRVKAVIKREKMTWPVLFDNGGSDGPVATKWGVRAWPTIYVIDAKGVIRFIGPRDEALSRAVKQLVAEAKKK